MRRPGQFAHDGYVTALRVAVVIGMGLRTVSAAALVVGTAAPLAAQGLFEQARSAAMRNQIDSAYRLLGRAAEAEPNRAEVHFWLAKVAGEKVVRRPIFLGIGAARRARTEAGRAVALEPDNPDYLGFLVEVFSRLPGILGGDKDSALVLAMRIHRLDAVRGARTVLDVLLRGNDRFRARHDSIVETISRSTAADRPTQLMIGSYCADRCPERALAIHRRLVERDSMDAFARYWAGRELVVLRRDPRRAQGYLWPVARGVRRPLDFGPAGYTPTDGAALWRLGQTYVQLGMPDSARALFQEALRANAGLQGARRSLDSLAQR